MLAVDENYRKKGIGSNLVLKAIKAMALGDADEVSLDFWTSFHLFIYNYFFFSFFFCSGRFRN